MTAWHLPYPIFLYGVDGSTSVRGVGGMIGTTEKEGLDSIPVSMSCLNGPNVK